METKQSLKIKQWYKNQSWRVDDKIKVIMKSTGRIGYINDYSARHLDPKMPTSHVGVLFEGNKNTRYIISSDLQLQS